jgi:xylulokinase
VIGRPQELLTVVEGAGYGAALLAGVAAGLVPFDTVWNRIAHAIAPSDGTADVYGQLYALYRELYPATLSQVHALAALQGGTPS